MRSSPLPLLSVLAASALGGLLLASPALACPGHDRAATASPSVAMTSPASADTDCPFAKGQSSCSLSFESKLFAASVPVGLSAFAFGWLAAGRRRRRDRPTTEG